MADKRGCNSPSKLAGTKAAKADILLDEISSKVRWPGMLRHIRRPAERKYRLDF